MKDLRIAALCTVGFAGFFRFSELSNMLCKHVVFLVDHIKIFVPHNKPDVYREGNFVYIAKTLFKYCPVSILLRYMREAIFHCSVLEASPGPDTSYVLRDFLIQDVGKCSRKLSVPWMRSEGLWPA